MCAPGLRRGALASVRLRAVTDADLEAWIFPRGFDPESVALIAREGRTPADLRGRLVSTRDDVLTLQLVAGKPPTASEFLLHVGGRGAFEILRAEEWPGGRVLLTLRAWRGAA